MKILSRTKKVNVRECCICGSSLEPMINYQVEWEITTVYENIWGNMKTKVNVQKDLLVFPTVETAILYAENVEAPSEPWSSYDIGKPYHYSAVIYPKGFEALRKKILKTDIDANSYNKFLKSFHIYNKHKLGNETDLQLEVNSRCVHFNFLPTIMESDPVKKLIIKYSASGNCNGRIVKTVDLSPVGSYESGVTGETDAYKKSRDEIIDSELERCKHYMSFLENMKK